jgi:hypothetical protein
MAGGVLRLPEGAGFLAVFLHVPLPYRIEKTPEIYFSERNNLWSESKAKRVLEDADRKQAEFIRSITGRDPQDPRNFHLAIDTCRVGWDMTLETIYSAALAVQQRLLQHEMAHV